MLMSLFGLSLLSFQSLVQAQEGCCCTDCICPPGPQGPSGVQGAQGVSGAQGLPGSTGAQGLQGLQGIQGIQGLQGPSGLQGPQGIPGQGLQGPQGIQGVPGVGGSTGAQGSQGLQGIPGIQGVPGSTGLQGLQGNTGAQGPCCPVVGTYTSVYSNLDQSLLSGDAATFELISATTASFDLSLAATTGEVIALKSGVYLVNWGVDAIEGSFAFPVPSWSFAITQNGVPLLSTASGSTSISPDDIVTHSSGVAIITVAAGDVFQLVNTSTSDVNILSLFFGTTIPVASARLNFVLLTAL